MDTKDIMAALEMEFRQSYRDLPVTLAGTGAAYHLCHEGYTVAFYDTRENEVTVQPYRGHVMIDTRKFRRRKDGSFDIRKMAAYLAEGFRQSKQRDAALRDWYGRFLAESERQGIAWRALDLTNAQLSSFRIRDRHLSNASVGERGLVCSNGSVAFGLSGPWSDENATIEGKDLLVYVLFEHSVDKVTVSVYARHTIGETLRTFCRELGQRYLDDAPLEFVSGKSPEETVAEILTVNRGLHETLANATARIAEHRAALGKSRDLVAEFPAPPVCVALAEIPDPERFEIRCGFTVKVTRGHGYDLLDKIHAIQRYCEDMGLTLKTTVRIPGSR